MLSDSLASKRPVHVAPRRGRALLVLALIVAYQVPQAASAAEPPAGLLETDRGLVVSVSKPGSEAGAEILERGGNAVDAAVATALALAVTYPPAGNLGGGGFMLIHPARGDDVVCVDYRETAPAAAHAHMFALGESVHTHKAVGVPGTVRGLALAHEQFGRLPWRELFGPAIRLAREGFELDVSLAASLNAILRRSREFDELQRVYGNPAGRSWKAGDRLRQPELAATLALIAEAGPDAFYEGAIAEKLVAEMQQGDGLITLEDLAGYRAKLRRPIRGTYRGYDVYGAPPPSSGGICLVQMLNVLEPFELRTRGRWSAETLHLMIEAMRRAYRDRARWLGDPDFVEIPADLTSPAYAARLAATIEARRATPSEELAEEIPLAAEAPSTTHFSVVDADGLAVSNTYTLEQSYGSRIVVRGAGFLLNNEMGDFNWVPGYTDRQGVIGTPANVIEPGKRMLSSQSPTIVARDGRAVLVTGSPGGRTIINTVLCVVLNLLEFELDPVEAVAAPRLHHAWFPDRVDFEPGFDAAGESLDELRCWGHDVRLRRAEQGDAHTIWIDPTSGRRLGVPDRRIEGHAAGH